MICYQFENLFFILRENNCPNNYCIHCFFQLLDKKILHKIQLVECPLELKKMNISLFPDEYLVYDSETEQIEKINLFTVPGCKGVRHNEVTDY